MKNETSQLIAWALGNIMTAPDAETLIAANTYQSRGFFRTNKSSCKHCGCKKDAHHGTETYCLQSVEELKARMMADKAAEERENRRLQEAREAEQLRETEATMSMLEACDAEVASLQDKWASVKIELKQSGQNSKELVLDLRECVERHQAIRKRGVPEATAGQDEQAALALRRKQEVFSQLQGLRTRLREIEEKRLTLIPDFSNKLKAAYHRSIAYQKAITNKVRDLEEATHRWATEGGGRRHLADITIDDEKVRAHWCLNHPVLPVYQRAAEMICVEQVWLTNTILLRQIDLTRKLFQAELEELKKDGKSFEKALVAAICKGYELSSDSAAKGRHDILTGQPCFGLVSRVYNSLESWKKPFFTHALRILADLQPDRAAVVAKLSEICDRATHCRQVQVKSFNLLLAHSYRLVLTDATSADVDSIGSLADARNAEYKKALQRFFEVGRLLASRRTRNTFCTHAQGLKRARTHTGV
jgi:hypothetical protein